jgi:ATP-binding cassette subfamily C protein PrsD
MSVRGRASSPELWDVFRSCRVWFGTVAIFSGFVNILFLTGSLYMLQVYDRVLTSRSTETLLALSVIVLVAFAVQGLLDGLRARMLARIGARFDDLLAPRVFQIVVEAPLLGARGDEVLAPVRDLDRIRTFLSGLGPTALFDIPFTPLFLIVTFLLHPWLGWLVVFGGVVLVALTLLTEAKSQVPARALAEIGAQRNKFIEATRRNAETLSALGMQTTFLDRFSHLSARHVRETLRSSDVVSHLGVFAKVFRLALQSGALGLGAYLAIHGEISGGAIIAASILTSRALAPVETAVAHWKGFVMARQSYWRLKRALELVPPFEGRTALPTPSHLLQVDGLVVAPPGTAKPVLLNVSLKLTAGDGLGIIGRTGSGKSTLARALAGVWRAARGEIRLDGATLPQWGAQLGRHIGYLPQDVELFDGTVAENIARFSRGADSTSIIAAAQASAAHDLILKLPNGYDTRLGEGGTTLSGGQRQRIALARALYGQPFLVVLDEPNANLDSEGEEALNNAVRSVRQRGGIVIVITHRPSGLAAVNLVAILTDGQLGALGARDEVARRLLQPATHLGTRTSLGRL